MIRRWELTEKPYKKVVFSDVSLFLIDKDVLEGLVVETFGQLKSALGEVNNGRLHITITGLTTKVSKITSAQLYWHNDQWRNQSSTETRGADQFNTNHD